MLGGLLRKLLGGLPVLGVEEEVDGGLAETAVGNGGDGRSGHQDRKRWSQRGAPE